MADEHDELDAAVPAVEPEDAPAEPEQGPLFELGEELKDLQERHLRLAAEYDNYRKRTTRERVEDRARAQGELARALLEPLDDLGRVAHLDPGQTAAADLAAGMLLVERKLLKLLAERGLERIGTEGEPFDPTVHEAIGSVPAERPEQDQTVAAVFQPGYRLGSQLLRPARVQVYVAAGA